MRHGFKTWAEKTATEYRRRVGLAPFSPLSALRLATTLGVFVIGPADVPGLSNDMIESLLGEGQDVWSAVTIIAGERTIIVHNTAHGDTRRESDLMHELAHLICKHKPTRIEPVGKFPWALRTFDPDQEKEAEWLGGCLQIPRDAILFLAKRGYDNTSIAEHFGASEDMARFRRNMTGVDKQIARVHYSTRR